VLLRQIRGEPEIQPPDGVATPGFGAGLSGRLMTGWIRVRVWNLDVQPPDSLRQTLRLSASLAWSPLPRLDFVGELLGGQRWSKDGQSGRATQLQVGSRFVF
jgi:hypothetical protein